MIQSSFDTNHPHPIVQPWDTPDEAAATALSLVKGWIAEDDDYIARGGSLQTIKLNAYKALVRAYETEKARLDCLQSLLGGYGVLLEQTRDDTSARQVAVRITTGVGSGPGQKVYQSPPGGITLRAALDVVRKQESLS